MHNILSAVPLVGYRLLVTFESKEQRIYDMSNCLFGVFEFLKEPSMFNAVELVDGAPTWYPPNGAMEVDICPDTVYIDSVPYREAIA